MDRHERIKFTLERIKLSKRLVAQQLELIRLARAMGYEPLYAPANLQRFRAQLADQRSALVDLTKSSQEPASQPSAQKAA
jgi:hypothetical protein